jgi:spermidine synthase
VLDKPEVESVTVIEKYQDVIDLVAPHYAHPKLTVICADIYEWTPPKGTVYDTIYFDIWPNICTDNLKDMEKLHRRFASKLNKANPHRWMDSWLKDALKAQLRREKRNPWGW